MTWGIESESGEVTGLEDGRVHTVGRDGLNHIVIGNSSVSNRHAELVAGAGGIEVRDSSLKPPTRVGERVLDGGRALANAGDEVRFGTAAFRVVDDAPAATRFWNVDAAFERLEAGANSLRSKGVWTRWWRGFDWRPIRGQFGKEGASFWLRAFGYWHSTWGGRTDVVGWLRSQAEPDALMSPGEVEAVVEQFRHSDELGMVAYLAQEVIGTRALLSCIDNHRKALPVEVFDWLGWFEPDDELIARAKSLRGESAYALLVPMFGHVDAAGLVPTTDLRLPIHHWAEQRGATDDELFELAMQGYGLGTDFVRRFAKHASDERWRQLSELLVTGTRYRSFAGAMSERPLPDLVGPFVLQDHAFTWEMGCWLSALGSDAAGGLRATWDQGEDRERRRVVRAIGLMSDAAVRQCWPAFGEDLKRAVERRFGPEIARDPSAARLAVVPDELRAVAEQTTVPERAFLYRDTTEWKELDLSRAPTVWTRDGAVMPAAIVRGFVATIAARRAFRDAPDQWDHPNFETERKEPVIVGDDWGPWYYDGVVPDFAPVEPEATDKIDPIRSFDALLTSEREWSVRREWQRLVEPRSSFRLWWYLRSIGPTLTTWNPNSWASLFIDDATVARELLEHPDARLEETYMFSSSDEMEWFFDWWSAWSKDRDEALGYVREELEENFPHAIPEEAAPMADALAASYVRCPRRFVFGDVRGWMRERVWMRRAFSKVVWQSDHGGEVTYFWWSPEGEICDVDHEPVELPGRASVWVTRGDAMPPAERVRWASLLADHEILQVADQLGDTRLDADRDGIAQLIGSNFDWYRLRDGWHFDIEFSDEHYPDGGVTVRRIDFGVWGGARVVIEGDYSSPSRELIAVDFFDEAGESVHPEDAPDFIVSLVLHDLREVDAS